MGEWRTLVIYKTFYTFLLHFALSFDRGMVMFMCDGGNEIKQLKK